MKRVSIAVAVLVALTLTGCAGTAESAPEQSSERAAPLVAESPSTDAEGGAEDAYLVGVREALEANGGSGIPDATDEQLLTAGADACEQMRAGADASDVRVIEDEQPTETGYTDSIRIAGSAAKYLCQDMDQS